MNFTVRYNQTIFQEEETVLFLLKNEEKFKVTARPIQTVIEQLSSRVQIFLINTFFHNM